MKTLVSMQDLSCLGKCSLTVIHPTISAMGVPCAVLPTALLSTHTAFPGPVVRDLSDFARPALAHWQSIGVEFGGILTGYAPTPDTVGFYYSDSETEFAHAAPRLPRSCHGTGDLFAAVTTGAILRGLSVPEAARLAAEFVHRSIANTGEDSRFGVAFEGQLGWLADSVR